MLDASLSNTASATREMRADLRKLEDAIPIGFVRVSGGWRYGTDFISRARAIWLTDKAVPGISAAWGFEMDDDRFEVRVLFEEPSDGSNF